MKVVKQVILHRQVNIILGYYKELLYSKLQTNKGSNRPSDVVQEEKLAVFIGNKQ